MGYTTQFEGKFKFSQPLTEEQYDTLVEFANDRHGDNMKEYPYAPSFYCQWIPTEDRQYLEWDGNEKFYSYVEWLTIIIDHFLKEWEITLNGNVFWQGEDCGDSGEIVVVDNVVSAIPLERRKPKYT